MIKFLFTVWQSYTHKLILMTPRLYWLWYKINREQFIIKKKLWKSQEFIIILSAEVWLKFTTLKPVELSFYFHISSHLPWPHLPHTHWKGFIFLSNSILFILLFIFFRLKTKLNWKSIFEFSCCSTIHFHYILLGMQVG